MHTRYIWIQNDVHGLKGINRLLGYLSKYLYDEEGSGQC